MKVQRSEIGWKKIFFKKNTDSTENKNSGLFIVLNEIEGEGKEHY